MQRCVIMLTAFPIWTFHYCSSSALDQPPCPCRLVRGLALWIRICHQAWSRNPPGAHKPSHPAFVLHPRPFSSKPALRCSPLAVSTDSRPLKTAPSRPDLSNTTVRATRLAALHPATLRAIVPESTRRHTQVNNTATPPARPCAWDPPTRRANYSSLTYTWLKPGPTIACTRCSCRS
jgi:hypothetical protein